MKLNEENENPQMLEIDEKKENEGREQNQDGNDGN